jgi:hypothetical protein
MNSKNISKGLLLGASLFLATATFAGEKATVKVYEDVKVNGKTLTAGKYDVEWTGTGDTAQLSILKGKETIATVPAKIVATKSAPASTGYSTKGEADGSKSLSSVFVAGKKYTFELGQEVSTAPAKAETAGNR